MNEIDQDLYSRQIYVLGNQAMLKLTKSKILLYGLGGLGIEIAKNLVLAGVGSLTIIDNKICAPSDLGSQFFINQNHIDSKLIRSRACLEDLKNLNPYVNLDYLELELESIDSDLLKNFNCLIISDLVETEVSVKINRLCRENGINFLLTNCVGLFGFSFTDFGDKFEVLDPDGEEYKDFFISKITRVDCGLVFETLDQHAHNLEQDDLIKITEIEGLQELNNQIIKIDKILNSFKFQVNINPSGVYTRGGVFRKIKKNLNISFSSLESQLNNPDLVLTDFNETKYFNPYLNHILFKSYSFRHSSYEAYLDRVLEEFRSSLFITEKEILEKNLKSLSKTFYDSVNSNYSPYSSIFGGLVAQEVLKSITNKFIPIKQFIYLDSAAELYESDSNWILKQDGFDELRKCFGGDSTLNKLLKTRLFMVGCGAIGCEMLKNYAQLGIGCNSGLITITDNDLIEKSNLNRQFLFRQKDIQRPKSQVAAEAVRKINSKMNIKVFEHKICPQTELDVFTDKFFLQQDVCVNALDNLEARRYMDSRCVSNHKALLESGTLAAKGHVQVILPHLTESYNSQKDPNDSESDIPYCTLKSFPSNIEHCIQWSRDKFESIFKIKPALLKKFLNTNCDLEHTISRLRSDESLIIEDCYKCAKFLKNYCFDWEQCLILARHKFEKYFSNKAKDILNIYPNDHLMSDGTPFWKLPKRQPGPVKFDTENKLHYEFVLSLARLLSEVFGLEDIKLQNTNVNMEILKQAESKVPDWRPRKKHIETDESKKKSDLDTNSKDMDNAKCADLLESFLKNLKNYNLNQAELRISTLDFEKDNDKNGHVDFIYASSNLRASMYSIENSDKLFVKKIAGKIVPAIATTTSCIAGFATLELIKIIQNDGKVEKFRNTFLNLAISFFLFSEPGSCQKVKITDGCYVSLWDKWSIKGNESFTLKQFIEQVKQKYKLTVSGVMFGSKSIYLPVMPTHAKRLNEKMIKLLKGVTNLAALGKSAENYSDLYLTYEECDNDTENRDKNNLCPPIRYYFS